MKAFKNSNMFDSNHGPGGGSGGGGFHGPGGGSNSNFQGPQGNQGGFCRGINTSDVLAEELSHGAIAMNLA